MPLFDLLFQFFHPLFQFFYLVVFAVFSNDTWSVTPTAVAPPTRTIAIILFSLTFSIAPLVVTIITHLFCQMMNKTL